MPTAFERDAVKPIFFESFSARDIAEPLASFDAEISSAEVLRAMDDGGFEIAGVRQSGRLSGFVEKSALGMGPCSQYLRPLDRAPQLSDDAPLLTVLIALKSVPFVLVTALGQAGGIIRTVDLQKPPVRMWLFGIVTVIEMRFTELIRRYCTSQRWEAQLSEARLRKARELEEFRRRANPSVQLLDCLQFSDKGQLVARNEDLRKYTVFTSRRHGQEVVRKLEQLRNSLAHAQDILVGDWDTIIELCEFISREPNHTDCDLKQLAAQPL